MKPAPIDINFEKYGLEIGDILVSRSNTRELVGLAGMYNGKPKKCIYPDLMMRVKTDEKIVSRYYLSNWLRHPISRIYFMSQARGTSGSMVKINQDILENMLIPVPPLKEQNKIAEILSRVDNTILSEKKNGEKIVVLRQGLMQVLLTGKVRVRLNEDGLHRIRNGRETYN